MLSQSARSNLKIRLMESADGARKLLESCRNERRREDDDLSFSSFEYSLGGRGVGAESETGENGRIVAKESLKI